MIEDIKTLFTVIMMCCVVLMMFMFSVENINGWTLKNEHLSVVSGVRRGIKAYSKQYDLSHEGLANISEGYLLAEDLNQLARDSNPLKVDSSAGMGTFVTYLADYANRPVEEVKDWDIYIVTIYTTFASTGIVDPTNGTIISSFYTFKIDSPSGEIISECTVPADSTEILSSTIGAALGVKLDLEGDSLYVGLPSIHKAQEYYRKNVGSKSVSTYTTFMAIGVDIPLKSRFGPDKNIDFCELQTFSSVR